MLNTPLFGSAYLVQGSTQKGVQRAMDTLSRTKARGEDKEIIERDKMVKQLDDNQRHIGWQQWAYSNHDDNALSIFRVCQARLMALVPAMLRKGIDPDNYSDVIECALSDEQFAQCHESLTAIQANAERIEA